MKRIALFCLLTLLLSSVCPACAWEVSPEYEATVAFLLPGWGLQDGIHSDGADVFLLTSPQGEKHLGFCTEESLTLTPALPDHLFLIADAHVFADTAMLLMEDYEGTAYFVGCIRKDTAWTITVSTALPSGAALQHPSPGNATLYWERPGAFGGERIGYKFKLGLLEDGRWLVMGTSFIHTASTRESRISYSRPFVCTEWRCLHGELLYSRDVTQVQWHSFPMTLEDAAAQMDLSGWATLGEEAALLDAPGGVPLARFNPGAHLLILGYKDSWVHVAPGGGVVSGWMAAEALFIGSRQLEAKYLAPYTCPVVNRYGNALEVYLLPSDATDNPLLICLEGMDAYPVCAMALWGDGTWTMLYAPAIPGGVGFVRTEQLNAEPANGVG